MKFKPEYLALGVNLAMLIYHGVQGAEIGKIVYWFGATILTVGVLLMKG